MKLTREDKIAIHCPTLELAEKVNKKLGKELGKESGKEELPKNLFTDARIKDSICLDIYNGENEYTTVTHARREWYEEGGYTIISAEQYLNIPTELKIEPFTKEEVFKEKKLIDYLSIGDKVYSITKGWGEVVDLGNYIIVDFKENHSIDKCKFAYLGNGKHSDTDLYPELYFEEVKIPKQELHKFKKGDLVWVSNNEIEWIVKFYIMKDDNRYIASSRHELNIQDYYYGYTYCKPFNEIQISK